MTDLQNFTQVCLLKFILTEGEKIVIFYFTSRDNQDSSTLRQAAEFGLISNLISIICRFIFQPLEEIAFNLFSKLKDSKPKSDEAEKLHPIEILVQYMAAMLGIGICAIIFSQVCSHDFILLVYSETWATESTVKIMKAYCIYLMFMAMNGMSEAFAYGLANQKVLN